MKVKQLLFLVMLFVAGSAMAQSVVERTYEVEKFLMEHGKFHLYSSEAISEDGFDEKYALSCAGIGEKISITADVGADGNLWELEDAGGDWYYIKNNKDCYIPDGNGMLKGCVGMGKGKALVVKLIRNVQDKFKGVIIESHIGSYFRNISIKYTSYSSFKLGSIPVESSSNCFYFVTLDGKTIDDVPEKVSYKFKYASSDNWCEGWDSNRKCVFNSPSELVDGALDTQYLGANFGNKSHQQFVINIRKALGVMARPVIAKAEEFGVELKYNVVDSLENRAKDCAVTKLSDITKRDSASITMFAKWLLHNEAEAESIKKKKETYIGDHVVIFTPQNNRWAWPTFKAWKQAFKPVNGYYYICETQDGALLYSASEDMVYIGYGGYDIVNGVLKSPLDKSNFTGVAMSEKAFLGQENPILYYRGKTFQSQDELSKYKEEERKIEIAKAQEEDKKYEAKKEKQRVANIKAHYARLTRQYGNKAVTAMLNDRPYVGMPAGILREGIKTDGIFILSSGWKITSSYGGRTVYSKGRRRCLAVNGVVKSVYTE